MRHLASTLIGPVEVPDRVSPAVIDDIAHGLPQMMPVLRAGLRFDAALRSAPLTPERSLSLIEGSQDYALCQLPREMQPERVADLLRELVTYNDPWDAGTLTIAIEALARTGQSRAHILASAARWVHTPQQLPAILGSDASALANLDNAARREVLCALAGRLALQAQEVRAPMASVLWSLITRHGPTTTTGELLRAAILERPGDGQIDPESFAALNRFHALVKDPEPLPRPADLQVRAHAPGIGQALAHFAYWLHCQRRPTLMSLVMLPPPKCWRHLEDYAADPLAAGTGRGASALDPLHMESRLAQFCVVLRER